MFLTSIYCKLKQVWEYLTYPSKHYAKKYAKRYVEEYSKNNKYVHHISTENDSRDYTDSDIDHSYNTFY